MNQITTVAVFALWTLGFVFGVYVLSTGKTKDFGYFLAVWLGPFVIAGAFALLIAIDH